MSLTLGGELPFATLTILSAWYQASDKSLTLGGELPFATHRERGIGPPLR